MQPKHPAFRKRNATEHKQPLYVHTQEQPEAAFFTLYQASSDENNIIDTCLRSVFLFASSTPERPFGREVIAQFQRSLLRCVNDASEFVAKEKKTKRHFKKFLSRINKDMMEHTLYNKEGIPWGLDVLLMVRYEKKFKIAVMGGISVYQRDLQGWYDILENERYLDDIHSVDSLGCSQSIDFDFFTVDLSEEAPGDVIVCNMDGCSVMEAIPTFYHRGEDVLRSRPLASALHAQNFPQSFLVSIPGSAMMGQRTQAIQ